MNTKIGLIGVVAAALVAGSAAYAQDMVTPGPVPGTDTVVVPAKKSAKGYASRVSTPLKTRTLTVAAPPAAAAATPGLTSPLGLITTPIGFAGNLITTPLNGLGQAFGFPTIGGTGRPLPIVARYADAGPVTDSVAEGWAQPVPVSANGPVYKLEPVKGGAFSPFTLISAPITAATTVAAAPFNAVGGVLGAPPAPAPVF